MKTIERVVREAIRDTESQTPIVRRLCDEVEDYLTECLIPLVVSDDQNIRDAAGVIYDRFKHGLMEEVAPVKVAEDFVPFARAISESAFISRADAEKNHEGVTTS